MAETKRVNLNLNLVGLKYLLKGAIKAGNDNVFIPTNDLNTLIILIEASLRDLRRLTLDLDTALEYLRAFHPGICEKVNASGHDHLECKKDAPDKCQSCKAWEFLNKPRKQIIQIPPGVNQ